jgi:uncharacterized membrane protein YoaK (UPF0700 family)
MAAGIRLTQGERTGLLIAALFSASAGAVDIIAYLEFDHVFVANMTGNTVLFAGELVGREFSKALTHLLPIITFLAGVVAARIWLAQIDRSDSPRLGFWLTLIAGVWIISAILLPNLGSVLIPVLAFSVGAQNASLLHLEKIPVNTAFISGNLEKLGEAIVSLFRKSADRDDKIKFIAFGTIWTAYAAGAAIGALAAQQIGKQSLVVPAGILCGSAILIFLTHLRSK